MAADKAPLFHSELRSAAFSPVPVEELRVKGPVVADSLFDPVDVARAEAMMIDRITGAQQMIEPTRPALTPEQWARELERNDERIASGHGFTAPLPADLFDKNEGDTALAAGGFYVGFDTGAGWQDVKDRHKAAALALYGQPFGFTRAHVKMLRETISLLWETGVTPADKEQREREDAAYGSLADLIEALLPPE